jgi:predicted DsbA family dithiol-disulfide isomerase
MKLPVIHVWSDIACPWCWIGKRRLELALSRFEPADTVELTYHSFELDPSAAKNQEGTYAERLSRKYGRTVAQAQQMVDEMTARAKDDGLTMDFTRVRATNTFDAHRLLHLALESKKQVALKERLMKAYFEEGLLVSDHDTLVRLAADVGVDETAVRRVLGGDLYAREVRADERDAAELGIRGVPFYVIGRYGVSGAQPPDVLREVIDKARREAA